MGRNRAREYADFVEHPRYGKGPRRTGLDVVDSRDGSVYCHWHSPLGVRVPNTAVAADVNRQARATLHVTHYFDARRVCRECRRPFLFFAEEQKHWYEELGFPLEADYLECPPCRKDEHRLRALRGRYEALLGNAQRTQEGTLELVECALALVESAVFTAELLPKLRGLLKPLTRDRMAPHAARARALEAAIDRLDAK
jgi:hypothetical protein